MPFTFKNSLIFIIVIVVALLVPFVVADGLRGTDPDGTNRKAVADAIMSAIHSEDGEIEPSLMDAALESGLQRQEIRHVARLARKEVQEDPSKLDKIQSDLEKLTLSTAHSDTVPPPKVVEFDSSTVYKPKAAWALPHSAHVASAKAVLSALRSPTYEVDPELMEKAIEEGWTRDHILQSVEAAKPRIKTTQPEITATE
mmetsp:Transcript_3235/g.4816  ORF Transcript_3235/g.4816 Transcript_3235/m.4816 type:complete len:199 (-) Transcript_3235:185-781(-)|eukprot:CAMPEP_0194204382 /NCGR_PEP_ID=MMETSP0156-20130528/3918_1 /TAXON_ID=33649 /ORGANISM="Thalassionema nitzschioides, Strain L26-B" /LENGTH=198 /DNA_ID=CAMNT_0038930379 /DNA_START=183 /DNA_END=779 /DNA_ORIENTATION=-